MDVELTDAGLRVAGPSLLYDALTDTILRLACTAAHLDSAATLVTALGPAAPPAPAFCKHITQISFTSLLLSAHGG